MMMTAAGTLKAARVVVLAPGGVACRLSPLRAAGRRGRGPDVRPAAKE